MIVLEPDYEILSPKDLRGQGKKEIYRNIETAARNCYRSEGDFDEEKQKAFLRRLIAMGHEAMLEHAIISVRFVVDRGISHELVRHREASYAQESTRYCNYGKSKFENQCAFINIDNAFETEEKREIIKEWAKACKDSETHYFNMLKLGAKPEIARSVLPNSLKTSLIVTANIREWRHILRLRAVGTTGKPHPQMREIMLPLLREFSEIIPELFDDLWNAAEQNASNKPIERETEGVN